MFFFPPYRGCALKPLLLGASKRGVSPSFISFPLPYLREGDKGRRLFEGRVTLIKNLKGVRCRKLR